MTERKKITDPFKLGMFFFWLPKFFLQKKEKKKRKEKRKKEEVKTHQTLSLCAL